MFGHAVSITKTNKPTKKSWTMFSNVKLPIAHQISICVCFHVDGFFLSLSVSQRCLLLLLRFFFHRVLFTYTARETFIVHNLTVLLFFLVSTTLRARSFFYSSSSSTSSWSFIFLFRQFNQSLDQCSDFNKQSTVSKKMYAFSFIWLVNAARVSSCDFFSIPTVSVSVSVCVYVVFFHLRFNC